MNRAKVASLRFGSIVLLLCLLLLIGLQQYASTNDNLPSKNVIVPSSRVPPSALNENSSSMSSMSSRRQQQAVVKDSTKDYQYLDSSAIHAKLLDYARTYSDVCQVTTAQQAYKLPPAGNANDCPLDANVTGCWIYILTIQDFVVHPPGSLSSKRLPEVIWNGELHGNERVVRIHLV